MFGASEKGQAEVVKALIAAEVDLVPRSNRGRLEGFSGLVRATPTVRKLQAIFGLGQHAACVITR